MLVSSWSKDVHSLPETYVFPPDQRAGDLIALACNNPIIDLNKVVDHHDRSETIQQILKAGREFGEVVGKYSVEVSKLVLRILDLICEGLGLEHGYFADELSQVQLLSVNQYPRCPDPSLAMGMHRHCDPNVVTILKQGNIDGLQVFKDGQWISVKPLPNAFVVIIGCQLQTMEKLVSSWFSIQTMPEDYIFPPDIRPGKLIVPLCKTIPVIDLSMAEARDRNSIIKKVLNASQEFGFFQVINHGVSENLMDDAMDLFKEFFDMPADDKASVYSDDPSHSCRLFTSSYKYGHEVVHFWRDNLRRPCHPSEECIQLWPQKPTRYQEVVSKYLVEVKELSFRILELISRGLGLEPGFFKESSQLQLMSANYYPPCPDPSLTLGILRHCDPSIITILLQDVPGLQVVKDGQWVGVDALPSAFVVNIGNQLEIISNGKLKSSVHRAVANSTVTRTTISTFINPPFDCVVEPAKALVNGLNAPQYSAFLYKDFVNSNGAFGSDTEAILK
ncbi:Hyoscyamine 6-dioxygenase [Camellia lanceoleosa]|uniref:Hyoscyamine 6-dioxygenase n=1 Tax=Camellia lanceoleosa TaxID=1840588 RepID=A0ACC0F0B8_9ERIC|nr:Hyoscyamine 6-dioxygenase [Camellia lanceoleosa]